jgi:coenzyme F420 hydrogenase subunit beta
MTENNRGLQGLCETVLERDLCTACGACVSLCPYLRSAAGRIVKLNDCDLSEGRCFAYCPRTEVDLDRIHMKVFQQAYRDVEMGPLKRVVMCRAADEAFRTRGQSGGTVSALMDFALKEGVIDGALLTHRNEAHLPEGRLARNREEVLECAGSSYVAGPTLETLNRADLQGAERIGVVGTPCQVLALGKMRTSDLPKRTPIDQVGLVVGLFCTWALTYGPFIQFLKDRVGLERIEKLDITPPPERLLKVTAGSRTLDIPLDEIRPFIRPSCEVCLDMTSELADVSVGTAEGVEGWNTVIVRTERGEDLLKRAESAGVVEVRPLPEENLRHLKEASLLKKKRALSVLKERGELEEGYLRLPPETLKKIL